MSNGNTYVADLPKQANAEVCEPPASDYTDAALMAPYTDGIGSDSLAPDATTGRIPVPNIREYVQRVIAAGNTAIQSRPSQSVGTAEVAGSETDMGKLVMNDTKLYNEVQKEYCYYEQRYRFALTKFLMKSTSGNQADNARAQQLLTFSRTLNLKLNSILEIMNFLAQERVQLVNGNKESINNANNEINTKLKNLQRSYDFLTQEDTIVKTQKEMVRFTEEKNNYTSNNVSTWVALNIIAVATIFYVYKS